MSLFSPTAKRAGLLLALAATLLAAYLAPEPDAAGDGVVLADRSARTAATTTTSAAPPAVAEPNRVGGKSSRQAPVPVLAILGRSGAPGDKGASLFAPEAWGQPPAGERVILAPPPPRAEAPQDLVPPLPFVAIGRYVEDGNEVFFLQHNDKNLAVRVGDVLAEHYKVESVQGARMTLRHLPTNQTQTLDVGGAS